MSMQSDFYDDDEVIDYRYYLDLVKTVLLKHYRTIFAISLFCVLAAVMYVQSQAPTYVSTVTLHIAPNDVAMFSFEQWMFSDDEKFQDTQIGILQSKKLLKRVVDTIDLHEARTLTPASFDAGLASKAKAWLASISDVEPAENFATEADRIASTASELSSLMTINKPPGREYSSLLNVTVRLADPELAAKTANAIADVYINLVFENEIDSAKKNQGFLTNRLSILREDLRLAEQRLQDYREQEDLLLNATGESEVDQELSSLSDRYFKARENRLRQENLYQQVRNTSSNRETWEKLPAISNHPSVRKVQSELFELTQRKNELSKRYGSRHNKMIALNSEIESVTRELSSQVSDIIDGIRNEYELSRKIEIAAEQTLSGVRDRKQLLGRKEFQINDLTQDVEAKREVYAIFLERLNQDGASGPMRNDNIWVADPAVVPNGGQRTSLTRAGLIALILSFGFTTGVGLLFELTRNTLGSADDVEKKLGKPFLGYLPLIKSGTLRPGIVLAEYMNNPQSRFSEALRTVRTAITLSAISKSDGAKVFLVTSSQSGEGKSSVALSLASTFGHTAKVLILDADLRKPSIEKILNQSNHKFPGVSDVIAKTTTLEDAIHSYEKESFDTLFAGGRTIRPLELLSSHQFQTLMQELGDRYDFIIIDSPPCVSVSDAYVLATHADSIIYVAKANATPVPEIRTCINRFANIDTEVTGVLINQVDFDAAHNQSKYRDYYEYHGYGLEESERGATKT